MAKVFDIARKSRLTLEQRAALLKTPIYSAKNVPTGTSVAVPSGFSYNKGWAIVRFVAPTPDATNQYLWTVCNGSNEQHGQILGTTDKLQGRVVVGGSSKNTSTASHYKVKAGENVVAGYSWRDDGYEFHTTLSGDDGDIYGSRQDFNDQTITMPRSSGGTELRIGSRNGGSESFNGPRIEFLEIGNEYLTEPQLYARMMQAARAPIFFIGMGQSLAKGFFTNEVDDLGTAREAAMGQLISELGGVPNIATINASQGATSVMKAHDTGNGYWWDEDRNEPGPKLYSMEAQLARLGIEPTFFYHAFGEGDANFIDRAGYKTNAQFQDAVRKMYSYINLRYPQATILIQGIGARKDSYSGAATKGTQKVREFQKTLASELPYVSYLIEAYDVALHTDLIHWSSAGCTAGGTRIGKSLATLLGKTSNGSRGPRISAVSRSTTTVTVTIAHDAGTDFTPTTAIQGFKYFDNSGNEIALSSVARASATSITMTLASAVAGTLYYAYDACSYITDNTKIVYDNATLPMPLQSYVGTVA